MNHWLNGMIAVNPSVIQIFIPPPPELFVRITEDEQTRITEDDDIRVTE